MKYFKENDFTSITTFKNALSKLSTNYYKDPNIKNIRNEMVNELIQKLNLDVALLTKNQKIDYVNAAIVDPCFSSRHLGALKRGVNSLFSCKGHTENLKPLFRSDSQNDLMKFRDELQKKESQDDLTDSLSSITIKQGI